MNDIGFNKTRLGRRFELSFGRFYLMVQFRWRKQSVVYMGRFEGDAVISESYLEPGDIVHYGPSGEHVVVEKKYRSVGLTAPFDKQDDKGEPHE